ncbi:hypothetical protein JCM3774_003297 [Rhodotorula dairenensis]
MSAFAVTLDRLLDQLKASAAAPAAPAPAPAPAASLAADAPRALALAHLERAVIRLQRAYSQLKDAGPRAPIQLLIRLKGRTHELLQALLDSDSVSDPDRNSRVVSSAHAQLARQAVEQIEAHLAMAAAATEATDTASSGMPRRHSRNSSTSDLPRRIPSSTTKTPEQSQAIPRARPCTSTSTSTRVPETASTAPSRQTVGHRRAQELSDCYTLARLAAGVVPSGKPLSSLLKLALAQNSTGDHGDSADDDAGPARLEERIKAQLRRAYFDSFRPRFHSGSEGSPSDDASSSSHHAAERKLAWTRLARDLVDAVLPLIPSRMRADPALYRIPASASQSSQSTSMRSIVESDLVQVPPLPSDASSSSSLREFEAACLAKLERLVRVLQRLCAPARDPDVRTLLDILKARAEQTVTRPVPTQVEELSTPQPDLVDLVQQTLDLAEAMKADLDRFQAEVRHYTAAAGNSPRDNDELQALIEQEAGPRERALVVDWYGGGEDGVRHATWSWCQRHRGDAASPKGEDLHAGHRVSREEFAHALAETLFAQQAVTIPDLDETPAPDLSPRVSWDGYGHAAGKQPDTTPAAATGNGNENILPPPLVVLAPLLFELQNQLQAVIIVACLVTLVTSIDQPATVSSGLDPLIQRLWTILDMSITRRTTYGHPATTTSGVPGTEVDESTQLAHLADEILAHFAAPSSSEPPRNARPAAAAAELETRVRSGVDRILRYEDPVWRVLSNRLKAAVETALLESIRRSSLGGAEPESVPSKRGQQMPSHLQTGRSNRAARSTPQSLLGSPRASRTGSLGSRSVIKGFDRPAFLADKTAELVGSRIVGEVWGHVNKVWSRALGWVGE